MKVLHVIPSIAPVRGGPSHAVIEMVRALQQQGVKVEVATTNDNGDNLLDVPLNQRSAYEQIPVWFFPRFSPPFHAVREFAFSSELTRWLWRSISNYDLLHIHAIFSYPSTVAMAIARQKDIPYIVRPLGQLCEWSLQQSARKKQIYLKVIERANLDGSQALHLTSKQEQQEVAQLGLSTRGFILPHGVTLPPLMPNARQLLRQQLHLPDDEPIILFLSRLHPKKGIDYLIPALAKLTHQRFHFVLAGNGDTDCEQKVKDLLDTYNLSDRTYIAGFVSGELKSLLLQGSDLFVLTSHSENFGFAVLEAMANQLPVVVTSGVALGDMVLQHQVGTVSSLEITAIAQAIDYHLCDLTCTQEMGKRARQVVADKYTWQEVSTSLSIIYQSISQISSKSHHPYVI